MGAPGYYVLCPEGHVIGVIEDDLCWGDPEDESSIYKELDKLTSSQCKVCGKLAKYEFCNYGDINDCLDHDNKIEYDSNDTYIIPKNHVGNVILRSAGVHIKQPKSILDNEEINESITSVQENVNYLTVTKGNHGYNVIFDSVNSEVVFRMKENVARELRDKLDLLLPKIRRIKYES